jgi:alanyl aminopeptidase
VSAIPDKYVVLLCCAALLACGPRRAAVAPEREAIPFGRLPADVRPTHYALALSIVPREERYSGTARIAITLDRRRAVLWMHGTDLDVSELVLETDAGEIPARWE